MNTATATIAANAAAVFIIVGNPKKKAKAANCGECFVACKKSSE